MEENLGAALGTFTRAKPSGEIRAFPGITVCCADVNFSMFNSSILTAPVREAPELDARIRTAAAYYEARGLPWSCWLCQGWIEERARGMVVEVFRRNGLHLVVELPGMEAPRLAPPSRSLPELVYRRVGDAPTRTDFHHIMAATFGIPASISREVYESPATWQGGMAGWVGYLEREAVATAATLTAAGVVGVYAVGTLPHHRRKGYAEAVMRHALAQARFASGIQRTVLQSSEQGFRLYEKMGYRTVTRYAVFAYS
jgi:ribosomal protein S18 acetylase RimI-like enzyme